MQRQKPPQRLLLVLLLLLLLLVLLLRLRLLWTHRSAILASWMHRASRLLVLSPER